MNSIVQEDQQICSQIQNFWLQVQYIVKTFCFSNGLPVKKIGEIDYWQHAKYYSASVEPLGNCLRRTGLFPRIAMTFTDIQIQ